MKTDHTAVGETALTESIIGAAFEVSNTLGCGYLERVYENALALELRYRGHRVEQQRETPVYYRNELVGADTECNGENGSDGRDAERPDDSRPFARTSRRFDRLRRPHGLKYRDTPAAGCG